MIINLNWWKVYCTVRVWWRHFLHDRHEKWNLWVAKFRGIPVFDNQAKACYHYIAGQITNNVIHEDLDVDEDQEIAEYIENIEKLKAQNIANVDDEGVRKSL